MLPATNQLTGERSEPKSWGRIGAVNVVLNRCFGGHVAPTWRAARGRQQGAPARMPTRITVRYLGSEVGKKVARPDTKGELLELAAKRLNLSTHVIRSPPLAARSSLGRECGSSARLKCHACPPGPRAGSRIASAVAASSGASSPTSGVYCTIGRRLCRRATWTDTGRDGRNTYPNKHDQGTGRCNT